MTVRVARPAPGPPPDWSFPAIDELRLTNGLRVLACHLPRRPIVHVRLVLTAGSLTEPLEIAGVGSAAAGALAEGTHRRDAEALTVALELLGAGFTARCGADDFVAGVSMPAARLAEALELLTEIVTEPSWPASEIERQRRQRLDGLRTERFRPAATGGRVFRATMFAEGTRQALPGGGDETTIRAYTREDIESFFAQRLRGALCTAVVAGDLDGIDVVQALETSLGSLTVPDDPSVLPRSAYTAGRPGPRIVVVDHPGAVQTNLSIGHLGPHARIPDRAALDVATSVVCGGFNSRLNLRLREQLGYTYGAQGGFNRSRDGGTFRVGCAVQTDATADSVTQTLDVIGGAVARPMTDEEVADFREGMILRGPVAFESTEAVVSRLVRIAVHDLPLDDPDTHRANVAATTGAAASEALARYLRPAQTIVVAAGDASRIREPLETIGHGDVTVVEP